MPRKGENIYKRKDGRWEGRYKVVYNDSGTAKYHSIYVKTYQSVKEKLIELKADSMPCTSSGKLMIKELFEEWLSEVKLKVKKSTYANYRMKTDKHILPEFGSMRYEHLTVKNIHCFIDKKLRDGLSAKYVSDIVIVFKSMAKYISRVHGFSNPLTDVILPKVTKNEMKLLSRSQQNMLRQYPIWNMNSTSLFVLVSLYTGLRVGEVCGLKWGDINFEKSILTVNRTVQRIRSGEHGTTLLINTPKSRASQQLEICGVIAVERNSALSVLLDYSDILQNERLLEVLRMPLFLDSRGTGETINTCGEILDSYVMNIQSMVQNSAVRFVVQYALPFAAKMMTDSFSYKLDRGDLSEAVERAFEAYLENERIYQNYIAPNKFRKKVISSI